MPATLTQDPIRVPGQPEVADDLEHLCSSFFGDLRVEVYGNVVGNGMSARIYVADVAIAGTTISLRDSLKGTHWERFERDAREAYERSLRPVSDWRGNTHWQAA